MGGHGGRCNKKEIIPSKSNRNVRCVLLSSAEFNSTMCMLHSFPTRLFYFCDQKKSFNFWPRAEKPRLTTRVLKSNFKRKTPDLQKQVKPRKLLTWIAKCFYNAFGFYSIHTISNSKKKFDAAKKWGKLYVWLFQINFSEEPIFSKFFEIPEKNWLQKTCFCQKKFFEKERNV